MPIAQKMYKALLCNLINNQRMFNLEIDDLAEKPYIPQKKNTSMNLLQMTCVIT